MSVGILPMVAPDAAGPAFLLNAAAAVAAAQRRAAQRRVAGPLQQGPGLGVFGFGRKRLAGVPFTGDRHRRLGEAAAFPSVVEVGCAAIGPNQRAGGEEIGVSAGYRCVTEGRPGFGLAG